MPHGEKEEEKERILARRFLSSGELQLLIIPLHFNDKFNETQLFTYNNSGRIKCDSL